MILLLILTNLLWITETVGGHVLVKNDGKLPIRHLTVNQLGFGSIGAGKAVVREVNEEFSLKDVTLFYYVDGIWWKSRHKVKFDSGAEDISITLSYAFHEKENLYDRTIEVRASNLRSFPESSKVQELTWNLNASRFLADKKLNSLHRGGTTED